MSGKKGGSEDGRTPGGGYSKRGRPRPGTGGFRKDRLEGKGPTPPAHMRPGPPARRAAAKAAKGGGRGVPGPRGNEREGDGRFRSDGPGENLAPRGSGEGPEM